MEEILAHSSFYKFPSVLWEGTTASFLKHWILFSHFFLFIDFFSLMNVNISRRLKIINKSQIFRPNTDFFVIALFFPSIWCVGGRGGPSPSHTLQTTFFFINKTNL